MAVVVPAKDEQARIGATVRASRLLPAVREVIVVDDGSSDRTAAVAAAAGARVLRHDRNRGKAAAMTTGGLGTDADVLLFLDADLTDTAGAAAPLVEAVVDGRADMTIAVLPGQRTPDGAPAGGRGLVVNLARAGTERALGWSPLQPLSGQRCLTRVAFRAALPLADGFGVETGLTIDLARAGFTVLEVPIDLAHRASGGDWRSQVHRARQWRDVARALIARRAFPFPGRPGSAGGPTSGARPPVR